VKLLEVWPVEIAVVASYEEAGENITELLQKSFDLFVKSTIPEAGERLLPEFPASPQARTSAFNYTATRWASN
jgi:hypothetical protein